MAKRPYLAPVGPDTPAPRRTPETITDALEGTGRDVLAAMRRTLARQIDKGEIAGNAIASAFRELRELDRLIRLADQADEQEATRADRDRTGRRAFDASAI